MKSEPTFEDLLYEEERPFWAALLESLPQPAPKTRVGDRLVSLVARDAAIVVTFTSGYGGKRWAGDFAFWCLESEDSSLRGVLARQRSHRAPGERFGRILRFPNGYSEGKLKTCRNPLYVRPAILREVELWLDNHPRDAKFATMAVRCGMRYAVRYDVRPGSGYSLCPRPGMPTS